MPPSGSQPGMPKKKIKIKENSINQYLHGYLNDLSMTKPEQLRVIAKRAGEVRKSVSHRQKYVGAETP